MKAKLKNICIVIERNAQIEKVVYDNYLGFDAKANKDFLENQIVNWSYFDENNEDQEIFFKVYVQRYLSHAGIATQWKKFKSNDLSALLIVRVNDEDESDVKSLVELSFHDNFEEMMGELLLVQNMTLLRYIKKNRQNRLAIAAQV